MKITEVKNSRVYCNGQALEYSPLEVVEKVAFTEHEFDLTSEAGQKVQQAAIYYRDAMNRLASDYAPGETGHMLSLQNMYKYCDSDDLRLEYSNIIAKVIIILR